MAEGKNFLSQIYVLFLAVASTAFIVTIYHCMIVIWRNRRQRANLQQHARVLGQADMRSSIENSIVELIPTPKYEKGKGFHDGECPVCLSEFEEGDEVRTLPECMHSFHVDCIDMWLYSHPNCPMCRTNATPSPLPLEISSSDLGLDGRTRRLEFSMSQDLGGQHMAV